MDIPLHWALDYLKGPSPHQSSRPQQQPTNPNPPPDLLPPSTLTTLHAALLASPLPALHAALTAFLARTLPPLLDSITALLASSPTLVAAGLLLLLSVLILQILSLAKRILLFWTRLAFRLALYACAGLLASLLWQRGLERSLVDGLAIAGRVGGWVMAVVGVWIEEYHKAQDVQRQSQGQQQQWGGQRGYSQGQGRGR